MSNHFKSNIRRRKYVWGNCAESAPPHFVRKCLCRENGASELEMYINARIDDLNDQLRRAISNHRKEMLEVLKWAKR